MKITGERWSLLKADFNLVGKREFMLPLLVQFSCSVLSDFLRPHEPQHTRLPCPLPTPRVHPNPCPLCRWCHPTISSSVIPFSSCPQSFPASGSFQMSQLFAAGGQSIGVQLKLCLTMQISSSLSLWLLASPNLPDFSLFLKHLKYLNIRFNFPIYFKNL